MDKTRQERAEVLNVRDSAMYLGISEARLWRLVRDENLKPVMTTPGDWHFSRSSLDDCIEGYYRESSDCRMKAGKWYSLVGLIATSLCLLLLIQGRLGLAVMGVFYCISVSVFGAGIRALWLAPLHLPKPRWAYKLFYWLFSVISGLAIFCVSMVMFGGDNAELFLVGAAAMSFVVGFLIHPDFWPLPSWVRAK